METLLEEFQSIKRVHAGEIRTLIHGQSDTSGASGPPIGANVRTRFGDTDYRQFEPGMLARYVPAEGDFWVTYDADTPAEYHAISPRAQFLAGYVPTTQPTPKE